MLANQCQAQVPTADELPARWNDTVVGQSGIIPMRCPATHPASGICGSAIKNE